MIYFPVLRTRRFSVQLKELTIGQSIALAKLPVHLEQAEITTFLKFAIDSVEGTSEDPSEWTVQERTLALCHYLAATNSENPDFEVGAGRYSDYFDGSADGNNARPVPLGEVGGDEWHLFDLTGRDAEVIESLQGELKDGMGEAFEGRAFWLLGAMAAQMRRKDEGKKDELPSGEYEQFVFERMKVFAAFPESDFSELLAMFLQKRRSLMHFFDIDFSDTGIVCLPKEAAAEKNLPPARFPVSTCLNAGTLGLLGKPV